MAVFCTACICAELVGQLLGDVRGRQCIKAAAGLYILVALFHALPSIRAGVDGFAPPAAQAASFGTAEETILRQARQDLAARLEAQIRDQTGLEAELAVALARTEEGVCATGVEVRLPADARASGREVVRDLLCEALSIGPETIVWTEEEQGG